MKNRFLYLSLIVFTALVMTSCASRKYGCPNSVGIKAQPRQVQATV